jgi:hypothetical protein
MTRRVPLRCLADRRRFFEKQEVLPLPLLEVADDDEASTSGFYGLLARLPVVHFRSGQLSAAHDGDEVALTRRSLSSRCSSHDALKSLTRLS